MIEIKSNEKLQKELTGLMPTSDDNRNRYLQAQTIYVSNEQELWDAWYMIRYSILVGNVRIQLADGVYNMRGSLILEDFLYSNKFSMYGNRVNPSAVVLNFPHGSNGINLIGCSGDILYMGGFTIDQAAAPEGDTYTKHGSGLIVQRGTKFYCVIRTDLSEAPSIFINNFANGVYVVNNGHLVRGRFKITDCYDGIEAVNNSIVNCQYSDITGIGKRPSDQADRLGNYNYSSGWGVRCSQNSKMDAHYSSIKDVYGGVLATDSSRVNVNNSYDKDHPNYTRVNGPTKMNISACVVLQAQYNSFIYANGNIDAVMEYRTVFNVDDSAYISRSTNTYALSTYNSIIFATRYSGEILIDGVYVVQNSFNTVTYNDDGNGERSFYLLRSEAGSYIYGNYIIASGVSTIIRALKNSHAEGYYLTITDVKNIADPLFTSYHQSLMRSTYTNIDDTLAKRISYNDNSESILYGDTIKVTAYSGDEFTTIYGGRTRKHGGTYTGDAFEYNPAADTTDANDSTTIVI